MFTYTAMLEDETKIIEKTILSDKFNYKVTNSYPEQAPGPWPLQTVRCHTPRSRTFHYPHESLRRILDYYHRKASLGWHMILQKGCSFTYQVRGHIILKTLACDKYHTF